MGQPGQVLGKLMIYFDIRYRLEKLNDYSPILPDYISTYVYIYVHYIKCLYMCEHMYILCMYKSMSSIYSNAAYKILGFFCLFWGILLFERPDHGFWF